jgi:hypothetical protein
MSALCQKQTSLAAASMSAQGTPRFVVPLERHTGLIVDAAGVRAFGW